MAKKLKPKKAVKKPAKKTVKKVAAKKVSKPAAKKVVAKAKAKKTTKNVTKKVVKKAIKKVVKKTAKKAVKKTAKKVVNVNLGKSITSLKKKLAKKATPKKVVAKVVAKPVSKPVVKKKVTAKKADTTTAKFVAHKTHLKAGDKAPYFEGIEQDGNTVSLSALTGKTVILYFYPKDDTPGCTATACSLRDEYKYLSDANYAVVGVSADDTKSHAKFAAKYELPFPLLADTDKTVIKAYDVWGTKQFMGKIYDGSIRTTFVLGPDGIIKEVITSVDTANHAQQILGM
jgi:peroxiredoxin Q/BCP